LKFKFHWQRSWARDLTLALGLKALSDGLQVFSFLICCYCGTTA